MRSRTKIQDDGAQISPSDREEEFRRIIIKWYEENGDKNLPWRITSDPWAVLSAAVLLRKTSTAQVARIFPEFMKAYPNPRALLNSRETELKELIRPLGMENLRAEALKRIARQIEEEYGGKVPCSEAKLKKLLGIGDYIASEVMLRACGEPRPLLDRNMIRLLERVFCMKSRKKRPHTDREIWAFARSLIPKSLDEAVAFSYGVLDFARKICRSKNPKCENCPLKKICLCRPK